MARIVRALLGIGLLVAPACEDPAPSCRERARAGAADAIAVCEAEYRRSGAAPDGVDLASLYLGAGRLDEAAALARPLTSSSEGAIALRVLGIVTGRLRSCDDAIVYLATARELHLRADDRRNLARDNHALAGALHDCNRFSEALAALDEAMVGAAALGDQRLLGYTHLLAADLFAKLGYVRAAEAEIDAAQALRAPADAAWRSFLQGSVEMSAARYASASAMFEQALAARPGADLDFAARLALTISLQHLGRLDEAARVLATVADEGRAEVRTARTYVAGAVAAADGHDVDAARLLEKAYGGRIDDEWGVGIATLRGRLAWNQDRAVAEQWLRRAVDHAEAMLRSEPAVELRPWLLASWRTPYELLFSLLAEAGRGDEAVAVWDLAQGRAFRDFLVDRRVDVLARDQMAMRAQSLRRAVPSLASVPAAPRSGVPTLADRLRGHDVLLLVVAEGQVWSAMVVDGRARLRRAGSLAELEPHLVALRVDPRDRSAAAALGAALVPSELVPPAPRPLHVVLDARLSALPLAAVQRQGRILAADRALIHAPSLSALGCRSRPPATGVRVVGDAGADLPSARREARWVGERFRIAPLVGERATRAAVLDGGGDLLHVAAHATLAGGAGALVLADGIVSADEIALAPAAPQLVVLAACSSAAALDPDQLGALSSAYLIAGARQVIATSRAVGDAGAGELVRRFYELGGDDHPVAALAAAQRELAEQSTFTDWAFFAAYGEDDSCRQRGQP